MVAKVLVSVGAVRRNGTNALELEQRVLADAMSERDAATTEARIMVEQHGGAPHEWQTTEGELLVDWMQLLLTLLNPAHANGRPVIPWFRDATARMSALNASCRRRWWPASTPNASLTSSAIPLDVRAAMALHLSPGCICRVLPALHIAGETSNLRVRLPRTPREEEGASHHLFISPHHPAS